MKKKLKAIIAVNKRGIIGNGNSIPWRCSEDLKHFKKMTMGGNCLVGRKTWEGLPKLEGRELIIVGDKHENLEVALQKDIDWVIGGKSIYEQTLHLCTELHISIINDYSDGDVLCPDLSKFNGEIFVYNFEPNLKIVVPEALNEVLKTAKEIKEASDIVDILNKYPKLLKDNIVCRHIIFEEKLIASGMSPEKARSTPRFLSCNCPKCRTYF